MKIQKSGSVVASAEANRLEKQAISQFAKTSLLPRNPEIAQPCKNINDFAWSRSMPARMPLSGPPGIVWNDFGDAKRFTMVAGSNCSTIFSYCWTIFDCSAISRAPNCLTICNIAERFRMPSDFWELSSSRCDQESEKSLKSYKNKRFGMKYLDSLDVSLPFKKQVISFVYEYCLFHPFNYFDFW